MTQDKNKELNITYNYLNLPAKVASFKSGSTDKVEYLYDAMGNKLAKRPNANAANTEYYLGDVVLKGSTFDVEYILTPEGKADKTTSGYIYEYHLKDHLGNTRVAYTANTSGTANVVQQADYYTFGMNIAINGANNTNKYLYNGKEFQDNALGGVGLDWYDYGARMYDPQLGRWMTLDPKATKVLCYLTIRLLC